MGGHFQHAHALLVAWHATVLIYFLPLKTTPAVDAGMREFRAHIFDISGHGTYAMLR